MTVPPISGEIQYVFPDGRLTYLGIALLQDIASGVAAGIAPATWGEIIGEILDQNDLQLALQALAADISNKQDVLVSGTNIKTINGQTLLGAGDLTVAGGTFGSASITFNNDGVSDVVIIGQTNIAAGSHINAWVQGTTVDFNDVEHLLFASRIGLTCGDIIVGVGFTIFAETELRLTGSVSVHWSWS